MNTVNIDNIPLGSYCTDQVYFDENFLLYFQQTEINSDILEILKDTGIVNVYTEGSFETTVNIDTDPLQTSDMTIALSVVKSVPKIQEKYEIYYNEVESIFRNLLQKRVFVFEEINNLIYGDIYKEVKANPFHYLNIHEYRIEGGNLYIEYMLKNMLFSLASVEASKRDIISNSTQSIEVCIASFLLDVGVLLIIEQLKAKNRDANIDIRNPKLASIIAKVTQNVLGNSFVPPIISSIINNSQKLIENPSHNLPAPIKNLIYQTIICSEFVYHTNPLPSNHNVLIPLHALQKIIKNQNIIVPPECIKSFSYTLGFIPVGSYVELVNGSAAYVVKSVLDSPKYPLVQILLTHDKTPKNKISIISTEPQEFNIQKLTAVENIPSLAALRKTLTNSKSET